jgi:hypothetical protein
VDDVPDGEKVLGLPAIPLAQARKALLLIRFLPEMRKELRDLRLRLQELEGDPGGRPARPGSDSR